MNREIKFRAWDGKRMAYADFYDLLENSSEDKFVGNKNWNTKDNPRPCLYLDDCEIMQYTGLKDKNGKEIYEGDIVKIKNKPYNSKKPIIVVWGKKSHGWSLKCAIDDYDVKVKYYGLGNSKDIEVKGNIYENPELL